MASISPIQISVEGPVARLEIDRPPLNILDIATMRAMTAQLTVLQQRRDLSVLVIGARGRLFSAGVDIPEHQADTIDEMLTVVHELFVTLYQLPMPTLCAVQGDALGGGMELAIACDVTLSADNARFGLPEISLGVFPPVAVAALHRLIGLKSATELILTGRIISAEEAQALGLVNQVFPAERFARGVDLFLEPFRLLSAFSLAQTKSALRRAAWPEFERALTEAESVYREGLMSGADPREGIMAFIEKRRPRWSHS